jgi:3-polyprenyl-4-hydroxybenzoate decarboxylase
VIASKAQQRRQQHQQEHKKQQQQQQQQHRKDLSLAIHRPAPRSLVRRSVVIAPCNTSAQARGAASW